MYDVDFHHLIIVVVVIISFHSILFGKLIEPNTNNARKASSCCVLCQFNDKIQSTTESTRMKFRFFFCVGNLSQCE